MSFSMNSTVGTKWLAGKIRENRETHQRKYGEAVGAFWAKSEEFALAQIEGIRAKDERFLATAKAGPFGAVQMQAVAGMLGLGGDKSPPSPPPCHVADYDRALAMVEAHQEEQVELDSSDFGRLVLDEWDWKGDFNSSYMRLTG